ncbi:hypothetical protein PVAG01_05072 [Phlyctema vagabunda]|uniref:DUF1996 domain-containing protein n=1 Tax=Phlyctema vagabunda TaxID=108571 RepID=A0ABR4PJ46_9HELO
MLFTTSTVAKVAALLATVSNVEAFWRMPCRQRTGIARIDPIVNFGEVSKHAHAIHGGNAISSTSTTSDLLASTCTSCEVSQDKSAYWFPQLYFENFGTGKFEAVDQVGGLLAYYLLFANSGETKVTAFPEGFQMISGDVNRRNFTAGPVPDNPKSEWTAEQSTESSLRQKAIGFNCLNYAKSPEGSLYRHFLPDKAYLDANCADGVRVEVMFPSCWNGKDLDSSDHMDHVRFPSQVMTGECPKGFETRLISLFYEVIWNTNAFKGVDGQFVLANGDPTGYGLHADFITGWETDFLQSAADQCTNASGQIEDCSLFDIQDGTDCSLVEPLTLKADNVLGPMDTLPGNPTIAYGPEPAVDESAGDNTVVNSGTQAVPTLSHSAGSTIASSDEYLPGGVFKAEATSSSTPSSSSTAESVSTPVASPTPTEPAFVAAAVPSGDDDEIVATSYTTSGREVLEVLWVEETVTVTQATTSTSTAYVKRDGRHMHRHRHNGRRA